MTIEAEWKQIASGMLNVIEKKRTKQTDWRLYHACTKATRYKSHFTYGTIFPDRPFHNFDVPELHQIRRSPDGEALKL